MMSVILTRTSEGVDASGADLAPYSKRYARESGKVTPNLRRTGNLLGTMKVKANKTSGYIHPTVPYAVLLNWGSKRYGFPRREFVGMSQADAETVAKTVDKIVIRNTAESLGARRSFARRGML